MGYVGRDICRHTTYLPIDALDECFTDLSKLLYFVVQWSSAPSRVKWIVSNRNWLRIEDQLRQAGRKFRLSLELNAEYESEGVSLY